MHAPLGTDLWGFTGYWSKATFAQRKLISTADARLANQSSRTWKARSERKRDRFLLTPARWKSGSLKCQIRSESSKQGEDWGTSLDYACLWTEVWSLERLCLLALTLKYLNPGYLPIKYQAGGRLYGYKILPFMNACRDFFFLKKSNHSFCKILRKDMAQKG